MPGTSRTSLLRLLPVALALMLIPSALFAQTVNYTYDAAGNRITRSAPSTRTMVMGMDRKIGVAPDPALPDDVDTALLRRAASARQLGLKERKTVAAPPFSCSAVAPASDAVSEAMERDHEERTGAWLAAHYAGEAGAGTRSLPFTSSTPVVNIPMEEGVSPTGARTYSIPIPTAYGLPFAPSVGICYNSQAGLGLAGYGWTLSGLSAITITGKTLYYHGEASAAKAGDPDGAFALDSEPLVANTLAPAMAGYTLMAPLSRVLVGKTVSGGRVTGFTARYPDGSTAVFSCDGADPADAYIFPIRQVVNAAGEKITFTYESYLDSGNSYLIKKIEYGFRSGVPQASLSFQYSTVSTYPVKFIGGVGVSAFKRLSSVTCLDGTSAIYTYQITYGQSDGAPVPVAVTCSRGASQAAPLTFSYPGVDTPSPSPATLFSKDSLSLPSSYDASLPYNFKRGRMVRDDFQDGLILYPARSAYSSSGGGYGSSYPSADVIIIYPTLGRSPLTLSAGSGFQTVEAVDVDADGRDEIVMVNYEQATSVSTKVKVSVHSFNKATRTIFNLRDITVRMDGSISSGGNYYPYQLEYYFGDFTGDGKTRLLVVSLRQNEFGVSQTCAACIVDLALGTVSPAIQLPQALYPAGRKNTFALDLDADSKAEFCWAAPSSTGIAAYDLSTGSFVLEGTFQGAGSEHLFDEPGKSFFTDINGDGLLDIVLPPEMTPATPDPGTGTITVPQFPNLWTFIRFTGKAFVPMLRDGFIPWNEGEEFLFLDVNHDGFADLVKLDATGKPSVHFNRLGSFDSSPTGSGLGSNPGCHLVGMPLTDYHGMSSYIQVDATKVRSFRSTGDALARRLVVSSTDSFGVKLESGYSAPESGGGYTDESLAVPSGGFARVKLPLRLLTTESKSMTSGVGPGSISSPWPDRVYRYYNLIVSTRGRGVCGFQKISVSDVELGSTTLYAPEWFCVPLAQASWLSGHENSPYATVSWSYGTWTDPKRPPLPAGTLSSSDVEARSVQTAFSDYDSWEFPRTVTTQTVVTDQSATPGVATTLTETVSTTYSHTATSALYHLGTVSSVTRTRLSSLLVSPNRMDTRTDYTYDAAFRPLSEKVWRAWGDGTTQGNYTLFSERRYTYDSFGNVTSEKYAGHGATTFLEKTRTYSPDGRRLLSATNELGITTTYGDYNALGQAGKASDYRGDATFSFDDWGQRTGSSLPGGSSESVSRSWGGEGLFTVTITPSDAPQEVTHLDALGREVRRSVRRFDSQWQSTDTRYDYRGRVAAVSLPHRSATVPSTNFITRSYDIHGRITTESEPSGRTSTWTYDGSASSVTKDGITTSSLTDAAGAVWQTTDPGGTVVNLMRIDGSPSFIYSSAGGRVTSLTYDVYGDRASISDPSGGMRTETRTWGSAGDCTHTFTSPLGTVTSSIDRYGRTTSVTRTGSFGTAFTYDTHGLLSGVSSTNGTGETYTYDAAGRVASVTHSGPDGRTLTETYAYGASGALASTAYSTQDGTVTTENYTYANGWLTRTSLPGGDTVWQLLAEDDFGHPSGGKTGVLSRTYSCDSLSGLPASRGITVGSSGTVLQADTYSFSASTGNLTARAGASSTCGEAFQYDGLDRLYAWSVDLYTRSAIYDALGNPSFKSGAGYYTYGNSAHPFQVTSISLSEPAALPSRAQTVTYNILDRPEILSEGGRKASFTYDASGDRVKMTVTDSLPGGTPSTLLERYYLGGRYEADRLPSGAVRQRLFLGGDPYSAPAVYVKDSTQAWTLLAIGRDYLGSVTHVADASSGTLLAEYSYDPWGRLRDPQTLAPLDTTSQAVPIIGGRGYTGHEHLPWFGLVNMNARLYDPLLGRFLSPDPYVQAPDFTQNFNRYSYALNNPLRYTDESGEFFFSLFMGPFGAVLDAACWGAVIGAASYTTGVALSDGGFNNWSWSDFGKSVGFGALSGAVTFGVGEAFSAFGNFAGTYGTELIRGVVHGLTQGGLSSLQGGDFWSGFASGTLGSWAASGYSILGLEQTLGDAGMLVFSSVAGGISSEINGGDFWKGACIGLVTASFNHLQHKTEEYKFFDRLRRHYSKGNGEDFIITGKEYNYLVSKGKIDYANAKLGEDGYYTASIDFYDAGFDLKYSFGKATMKFYSKGMYTKLLGFYDRYDFDAKSWGERSILAELITRGYGVIGSGTSFDIFYRRSIFVK